MSFKRWCDDWRRRCEHAGWRPLSGVVCILLAILILLIWAPSWLIAVILSLLLLSLGFWLI